MVDAAWLDDAVDPFRQHNAVVSPAELDFVLESQVPVNRDDNLGLRIPSALHVTTLKRRNKVDA
eukprot:2111476-Pyramimonas_sp.AAC.1